MTPQLQIDAVLFDLDGTLVDESRSYREAIRKTAEFLLAGPVTPEEVEEIKRIPGYNNDWDATWAVVGRRIHGAILPVSAAERDSYAYRRMVNIFQTYYLGDALWQEIGGIEPPFPWSEPLILHETLMVPLETLAPLVRFKLGIATSRPRAEALFALRQHGLDRFFAAEVVVAREDALREKPHPAPLLELVRRLGCSRPVYVGDTVNDALAASAAGMPYVHVGLEPIPGGDVIHLEGLTALVEVCTGQMR